MVKNLQLHALNKQKILPNIIASFQIKPNIPHLEGLAISMADELSSHDSRRTEVITPWRPPSISSQHYVRVVDESIVITMSRSVGLESKLVSTCDVC